MWRRARVVALDADALVVHVSRVGCERCAAGQGCGAGLMTRLLSPEQFELRLPLAQLQLKAADLQRLQPATEVWLVGSDALLSTLALRLYALPCIAFLVALGLVHLWARTQLDGFALDALSLLAGIAALLLSWRWSAPISQAIPFWHGLRVVLGTRPETGSCTSEMET